MTSQKIQLPLRQVFLFFPVVIWTLQRYQYHLYLSCEVMCIGLSVLSSLGFLFVEFLFFLQDSIGVKLTTLTATHIFLFCLENMSKLCLTLLQTCSLIWFPWFLSYWYRVGFFHLPQLFWMVAYVGGLPGFLTWWVPKAPFFLTLCRATSRPSPRFLITTTHAGPDPLPQNPTCWEQREAQLHHQSWNEHT